MWYVHTVDAMSPKQSPKIKHWEVISHECANECTYSWRCIGVGDVIIDSSPPFSSYGAALSDAIKHGFEPKLHRWVNVDKHFTFHFGRGDKKPIAVPRAGPRRRKTDSPAGHQDADSTNKQ
jgi:hypothetical protein